MTREYPAGQMRIKELPPRERFTNRHRSPSTTVWEESEEDFEWQEAVLHGMYTKMIDYMMNDGGDQTGSISVIAEAIRDKSRYNRPSNRRSGGRSTSLTLVLEGALNADCT